MKHLLLKISPSLALAFSGFLYQSAYAETLVFKDFPENGSWNLAVEQPVTSESGKSVGTLKVYFLSTDDPNKANNMVTVTSMERSPNIGAREYMINMARSVQMNCESMQVSQPTLVIEQRVPVSYARVYCGKHKQMNGGVIQSIKTLQGKNTLFSIVRQWSTPLFGFQISIADRDGFAKSVFKTSEEALTWFSQMDAANNHLINAITLCSNNSDEFGNSCQTK
jgi:hypothetical protein